ncbi:MAG TPA: phosphodiester glycosidase family protein [Acidimicrobiia bacterium]|nr:phosphodiester glycosidase family protein [Acidimicrobiia bacterium]
MPDRPPDPAEGEGQHYSLPNEYGPHDAPNRPDDLDFYDDTTPAVTLHERDAEPVAPVVAPVAPVAPVVAGPSTNGKGDAGAPLSRREIREQREREQAAAKQQGNGPKKTRSKRAKWIRRGVALVVVLALIPVAVSYVDYLNKPGSDTLSVRTVEWIRDNGGNGIVNTVERWWYTNNPPPTGGSPDAIKTQKTVVESTGKATATTAPPQIQHLTPPTARVPTPATDVQENEGVWQPTGRLVAGQPAVYTTYVRPDAVHTSYYTGLMWLDTRLLRANYVVGLEQPGGGPNPWGSQIPPDQIPNAIAAFNSGFKMDSANGGAYLDGQEIVPLRDGAASLIIRQDGSADVGVWGRDFTMSPDIKAVRQNLVLIVDNGQLNPGLNENDNSAFGATLGGNVYVWRSGVGVTADGALVYAGGPAMSITAVARTLQAAGAVRAMEMDINTDWVSAFTYQPNVTLPGNPIEGVKLLDGMTHDGSQYLQPNSRDFFAFTADPKVVVPTTTTTTTKPKKR